MRSSVAYRFFRRNVFRKAGRWPAAILREYRESELDLRATGLVYNSLLSATPFLAVGFSILKAFGVHNQLEPFLLKALAPLGDKAPEVVGRLIGFVDGINVSLLGVVGFAALFYSALSLLEKVEAAFNHIWRVAKPRGFSRRFSDYLSVLMVGPVLVFSGTGLVGAALNSAAAQRLFALKPFSWASFAVDTLLPHLLVIGGFAFLYLFIPNTRVTARAAWAGGLFAGLGWKLTGVLFADFVSGSASYSAVYSGFAAAILFMLWLYASWLILLVGGAVAFHVQYPLYLNYASRHPQLSGHCQEQLALELICLIGIRQNRGQPAMHLHELADACGMPWETVSGALEALEHCRLLSGSPEDGEPYRLQQDTDGIAVADILQAVHAYGRAGCTHRVLPKDARHNLEELREKLRQAAEQTVGQLTLRDLIAAQGDTEQPVLPPQPGNRARHG